MRVALTGTPGTGKSTVASQLGDGLEIITLEEVAIEAEIVAERDAVRNTDIIDIDALREATADLDDILIDSHLSHHLPVDLVVVLRCEPTVLEGRLRTRGMAERSIIENAQSEALDLILAEAVAHHGREAVYEIDTTEQTIDAVVEEVQAAIEGELEPRAGIVDFTGYL